MQIGPLTLPFILIRVFVALAVGLGVQLIFYRSQKRSIKLFWDIIFDSLLLGLLLWKIAPIFAKPSALWTDPIAALYRPGGQIGLVLGVIGAVSTAVIRVYRSRPVPVRFFNILAISLLIILLVFIIAGAVRGLDSAAERSGVRDLIKELSKPLSDNGGTRGNVKWDADYLIVNAWASWCPPCRGEMPELSAFYKSNKNRDIELIGLNMTSTEKSVEGVTKIIEAYSIPFPVLLDPEGELSRHLEIETLPTTIIVGPQGKVIARHNGIVDRYWLQRHTH